MTVVIESSYIPRAWSLPVHARSQRFAVLICHRRAGKTLMCVADLVDKAMQCPLHRPQYSYIAPFYSQAKSVAWNYLKDLTAGIADKVMESELSVVLKGNGAKIRLFGADNPDALRGLYHDGAILDEYEDMAPRMFGEIIAPALTDRKGWAMFIGTVKGSAGIWALYTKALDDPAWFTLVLRASESGIIPPEELESTRTSPGCDENTYRQEFECDPTAAVRGAYYGEQLNELGARHFGEYKHDLSKLVFTAWDIGYTDDTSVWMYQFNGAEIAIIDFFTVSGYSVDEVLAELRAKPYMYGTAFLPHDAKNKSFQTGKSTRELMMAAGMQTSIVPSLSVQDGIQAVRHTLPRVYFNTASPDVRVGLNALRLYSRKWDEKRQMFMQAPDHTWASNPADAFRMLALATTPGAQRAGATNLGGKGPRMPTAQVITLEGLYADRKARTSNGRI